MAQRGSGESMCVVWIILLCFARKLDDYSTMSKRWWCGINTDNADEHRGLIYVFIYRLLNTVWWIQNTITIANSFCTTEMNLVSSLLSAWGYRILELRKILPLELIQFVRSQGRAV